MPDGLGFVFDSCDTVAWGLLVGFLSGGGHGVSMFASNLEANIIVPIMGA